MQQVNEITYMFKLASSYFFISVKKKANVSSIRTHHIACRILEVTPIVTAAKSSAKILDVLL